MPPIQCICGPSFPARSYWHHRQIKHVHCCGAYFAGKNWSKHEKETGHAGVEIRPQPKKQQVSKGRCRDLIDCELGCGSTLERHRMPKHRGSKHYKCDSCGLTFLLKGRIQHRYKTAHDHYTEVNLPNPEQLAAGPGASTRLTMSDSVTWSESNVTAEMRRKYDFPIRTLLRECQTSPIPALPTGSRWNRNRRLLQRIFPEDRDIPFARIGTFSDTTDDAEVWYVTEKQIEEKVIDRGFVLRKPTVIKSHPAGRCGRSLDLFLEALHNHFAGSRVDVQDLSTTKTRPVSMPVDAVIKRIREGPDFRAGQLPINLLNLKYFGQAPPTPTFLNMPRFDVLPAIGSHLEAEFSRDATAGKRGHATAREVDLDRSLTFSLFAQRGSFTGFHVDCPDGTWVSNEWGLKLWIFARSSDEADMTKFAEEGAEWAPKDIAVIVLEPGDALVMPPAEVVPHAVLTLEDSHMVGGMFMDAHRIVDSIQKLFWIATHPTVTNEAIPLQLLSGWEHLRNRFLAQDRPVADRDKFDEISELLRAQLSCQCPGPCRKKCSACRCSSSLAQDERCTSWCHRAPGSNKRKLSTRASASSGAD